MNRTVIPQKEAKKALLQVLDDIEASVVSTLGPKGKTVVLVDDTGAPKLTKDGVSVAKYLHYEDTLKQAILDIIRESSIKIADKVGDGTTTAIMLTVGLLRESLKTYDTIDREFMYSLESGADFIISFITNSAKKVDIGSDILEKIVFTSTNNDRTLTDLIMEASNSVGKFGLIKAVKGTMEDDANIVDIVSGIKFDSKIIVTPYDLTTQQVIKNKSRLLLVEGPINNVSDIKAILIDPEFNTSDLIIVASEFSDKVKNVCIINNMNRTRRVTLLNAESFAPNRLTILEDVSELLGTPVYSTNGSTANKLKNANINDLGEVFEYVISKEEFVATVYNKVQKDFSDKISYLHEELKKLERSTFEDYVSKQHILRFRLNKFVKVANIKIIGKTKRETEEILDRVDDALSAYKAALVNGVIPGGGTMLLSAYANVQNKLDDLVKDILFNVAKYPIIYLVNSEEVVSTIVQTIFDGKFISYDVLTSRYITDADDALIYDPADVLISALDTAVNITKTILNTSAFVIETQYGQI